MNLSQFGRSSDRSIRIRWNETPPATPSDNEFPAKGRGLLELLIGDQSRDQKVSVAHYEDEFHATVTFPDKRAARDAGDRIATRIAYSGHFDNHFSGLTILRSPENAQIDICAVHGLHGNAIDSFSTSTNLWLRDILPNQKPFQTARIMTFGYNSKLIESGTVVGMKDWADELMRAVGGVRGEDTTYNDVPIIFVCHSMGGLVARKAMERLHQFTNQPDEYPGICLSNCGILFLSTPHLGTVQADFGKVFSLAMASLTGIRTEAILTELQSFNSSAHNALDSWRVMQNSGVAPPFECLCESRKTKIGGLADREVVSVVAAGFLNQTATTLSNTDHHTVCKFPNPFDQAYKDVIMKLVVLRRKLLRKDLAAIPVQTPLKLPGQPNATAYHYPLAMDRRSYFGMPFQRRTGFSGRQDILNRLQLGSEEGKKIIALSGVGGAGKTEVLLEYALMARHSNHIFFCRANPGQNFETCIAKLANLVGSEVLEDHVDLSVREMLWNSYKDDKRAEAFIRWLRSGPEGSTLVLFDDVDAFEGEDDYEALSDAIRQWPHTILLTTRNPFLGGTLAGESWRDVESHCVEALSPEELIPVMRRFLEVGMQISQDDLATIARLMEGHVMAACRAVQFISQELELAVGEDPVQLFISSFDGTSDNFEMREEFIRFKPHPGRSLATCFGTSIERLGGLERTATRILSFAAYLTVPDVDFRLFFQHKRPWLQAIPAGQHFLTKEILALSDADLRKALRQLISTSALIRVGRVLTVHRLMQEYLFHRHGAAGRRNILRQIMLLGSISISLDEQISMFQKIVVNCQTIARRFGVSIDDITPTSDDLNTIKFSMENTGLITKLDQLIQAKRALLHGFRGDNEQKIRFLNEVLPVIVKFKRIRYKLTQAEQQVAHNRPEMLQRMIELVKGLSPKFHHNLLGETE